MVPVDQAPRERIQTADVVRDDAIERATRAEHAASALRVELQNTERQPDSVTSDTSSLTTVLDDVRRSGPKQSATITGLEAVHQELQLRFLRSQPAARTTGD